MASGPTPEDVQNLIRTVQIPSVQKPNLQAICSANGIGKTGNKSDLQRRIVQRINDSAASRDIQAFDQMRASIHSHTQLKGPLMNPSPQAQSRYAPPNLSAAASPYSGIAENLSHRSGYGPANMSRAPNLPFSQTFTFKTSPFYEVKARIGDLKVLEAMSAHRNSVTVNVKTQENQLLQDCLTDPCMRVMVFCAGGNTAVQDIAFPQQSELKVNGGEIKANLRGLKNKPGSTRPVDITDALRLKLASYSNNVEFTYALTQKKFYFGVYICKTATVSKLVEVVRQGKKLSRSTVLLDMSKKASDPDVVATSQVVDLKCPISFTRPTTACRGMACSHLSCFDAAAYLQLQDQAPQWVCPVCEKALPFSQLVVDEYMTEILGMTTSSTDQVTIDPTGQWSTPSPQGSNSNPTLGGSSLLDDDDLVVAEVKSSGQRTNMTPSRAMAGLGTPQAPKSREASTPQAATGSKRTAEVIDLTLSDDDAPAQPCPKRPNTGNNMLWGPERPY